ncbi:MAG: hypothetical protein ACOVO1_11230 [Chitinophagaceae bacterium]
MNNLNDMEKFDSVFRDAANNFELPFNQEAWILMQQKLDKKPKRRFLFWWWIPIGIIAISLSIFTFFKTTTKTSSITFESIANNTNKTNGTNELQDTKTENLNTENRNQSSKEASKNTHLSIFSKESEHSNIGINEVFADKATTKKNIENQLNNNINFTKKISSNNNNIIPQNATTSNIKTEKKQNNFSTNNSLNTIEKIENTNSLKNATYTANILYLHNRYLLSFSEIEKNNLTVIEKRNAALLKIIEEEKRPIIRPVYSGFLPSNRWFLSTSIANNIGYVSNPQIKNTQLQFKLELGYNISKHTSIQTGISFGSRQFNMRKDQFAYKGPRALDKYIRDINADISLFEIPINLRYQYSNKENFGWYSNIGISSVFLKKENYLVTIDNGTIIYLPQNFENTNSVFSMLNLSFGYQFPINKNFTLTTEPYIQLPFKVIGEGGSKISSIGLQIGAKYNFIKRTK